jgi:type IV pilus assembly protein PilQ
MKAPPIEIERAQTIVKKIDKVTPQVIIEARVVEVTKDFTRSLGTAWNASGGPIVHNALGKLGGLVSGTNVDTATGLNLLPNDSPTGLIYNVAMNHSVAGTSSIGFDFSRLPGSSLLLNAQLTAQETQGNAKIISSPKVLTRDNETAKIKQGKEYPYLERDDSGGSSVKFKDIDLLLEVTPHITPDQRIAMKLKITKNDLAGFFGDVPTVSTNEVETAVLVDNGDTIVIGGIVQSSSNISSTGTPWLSKIPGLGWLFKNKLNNTTDNELLVFITPKILQL